MVREKWFAKRIAAIVLTGFLPLALPGIALALNDGRETMGEAKSQEVPKETAPAKSQTASKDTTPTESQPAAEGGSLAGVGKKSDSIGLRGTYYIAQGSDNIRLYGGIQARHHLHKAFAIELSADYRQENYNKTDAKNITTSIEVVPVQLSLLAYLMPGSRFSPFLMAGPGYYYTHLYGPNQNNSVQHRFGVHGGGGVQYFLNDCVSLDATYRYVVMQSFQQRLLSNSVYSINDSGSQVTFGLNWHF